MGIWVDGAHSSCALYQPSLFYLSFELWWPQMSLSSPIPGAIISMPIINRIIPMMKPAKTAPKKGDTIIIIANITAKTPTPM